MDVAWGWDEHVFAVVEAAVAPAPTVPPPSGKSSSKKAAAKEAELRWVGGLRAAQEDAGRLLARQCWANCRVVLLEELQQR